MGEYLPIILICIVTSFFSNILFQKIFIQNNLTDEATERSSHKVIATRSGGISLFMVIFTFSCFFYFSGSEVFDFSYLVPLSLLMLVGLYDDIYRIDFKLKFIFQIIAAKIIIDNGLIIDNLHGVFDIFGLNRVLAQMITIFFIVAIINSINFIDGIDGLAISIVSLFIILFEAFSFYETGFSFLSVMILASIVPVYYFNFKNERKVFLGDSGSLFLGCIVSIYVINILSQEYIIKDRYDMHKIIFVISILFYPIIDIIRIVFKRLVEGKSPFEADKKHMHHLILRLVKSHFVTTLVITISSILFMISLQLVF